MVMNKNTHCNGQRVGFLEKKREREREEGKTITDSQTKTELLMRSS